MTRRVAWLAALAALALGVAVARVSAGAFTDTRANPQTLVAASTWPTPTPTPTPTPPLEYRNLTPNQATGDDTISLAFRLRNTGTSSIALNTVELRYWFTRDGASLASLSAWCDYAQLACTTINRTVETWPTRPKADTYLKVTFKSGSLAVGASSGEMNLRVTRSGGNFDETNDYSWLATDVFTASDKVAAYVGGNRVWGVEP